LDHEHPVGGPEPRQQAPFQEIRGLSADGLKTDAFDGLVDHRVDAGSCFLGGLVPEDEDFLAGLIHVAGKLPHLPMPESQGRPARDTIARMSNERLGGGVDGLTGGYRSEPEPDSELARRVSGSPVLSRQELRERRWWVERYSIDDPGRLPVYGFDLLKLEEAGWGVVFSSEATVPDIREALTPLLSRRQQQAGRGYVELTYRLGEDKLDFLAAHRSVPGAVDPRRVPYYLLLVGSPETIPFSFQQDLDIQYAVGRIWFDCLEDFANYAAGVVRAEAQPSLRRKRLAFFSPENDEATRRLSRDWIAPLAQKVAGPEHEILRWTGLEARKERLRQLLGGGETPSLLFLASHGLAFPEGHALRPSDQGALVCQDWPGPERGGPLSPGHYFSAGDVPVDADLQGLIAFLLADFAGGDGPSLARLPQRLLGHPRGGALAVVSLVDRSWGMSFGPTGSSRVEFARRVLQTLLAGEPLGFAMQFLNQLQAEVSVQLASALARNEGASPKELLRERFAGLWRVLQDTRNLVVFGDPAVRLHDQLPTRTSR
jgi:hypothetical protein